MDFLRLGSIPLTTFACFNYNEATKSYKDGSALNKKYLNSRNVEHSQITIYKFELKIGPVSIQTVFFHFKHSSPSSSRYKIEVEVEVLPSRHFR